MKNILLIEPNAALAQLYKQVFTGAGYAVSHVTGAQAAIDAADAERPDAVVLELQLAGHSGVEFLHEFRSYPEWWGIPIIINTNIMPSVITGLREPLQDDLGVCKILYKPKTSLEVLLGEVQKQLGAA